MPEQGDLLMVTDWGGQPKALVEMVSVTLCSFDEIDTAFAAEEGEGDGCLAWWREAHRTFFEREMKAKGGEFDEHAGAGAIPGGGAAAVNEAVSRRASCLPPSPQDARSSTIQISQSP